MNVLWDWQSFSIRDPRGAVSRLLGLGWPSNLRWQFFFAACFAAAAVAAMEQWLILSIVAPDLEASGLLRSALTGIFVQILLAVSQTIVGGFFGGRGTFDDILVMQGWAQAVMILPGVALGLATLALPNAAGLMLFAFAGFALRIIVLGFQQAHGFESPWKALGVAFLSGLAVLPVLALLGSVFFAL